MEPTRELISLVLIWENRDRSWIKEPDIFSDKNMHQDNERIYIVFKSVVLEIDSLAMDI